MMVSLINFWRRHIHRHPAATARREEAKRARAVHNSRASKERTRCVMLARGLASQRGIVG